MKDFNVIIKIGAIADNEDQALDQLSDILFFVQENLSMDNYSIDVVEVGEFVE